MCALLRRDNNHFGARAEGKTLIRKLIHLNYRTGKDVMGCKQQIQWKVEAFSSGRLFFMLYSFLGSLALKDR